MSGVVLLVEDNKEIAASSSELLETYGFTVHVAYSTQEALALLAQVGKVDLLFSDIRLGTGADGIQLASTFAEQLPDVPIVLTTGYSSQYKKALTVHWTMVPKPYLCKELAELFDKLLKHE